MSSVWSLTYIKTELSLVKVFNSVTETFLEELDGNIFDTEVQQGSFVHKKAGRAVIEKFTDSLRAEMISDSLITEWYNRGILVYPKQHSLFTLVDTVIHLGHIRNSGRGGRHELAKRLENKPDKNYFLLFLFMDFQRLLSKKLNADLVHLMYDASPAGSITSVHLYRSGLLVDDYYYAELNGEPYLVELLKHPESAKKILDGRFAFLTEQPRIRDLFGESYPVYFTGDDIWPPYVGKPRDVFKVQASNLFVPYHDEQVLPFGVIYCPTKDLPGYFLERYKT